MAAYRRVDDLTVTCRLTASTPGSAPGPTLGIEYGKPLPLPLPVSLWGGGAGSPYNVAGAQAYLRAKFHLDPSNRLATIHQRHRQTDRQRTHSIGRTVLQTVRPKIVSRRHTD